MGCCQSVESDAENDNYPRRILQQRSTESAYNPRPILQQRSTANDYNPRTNNTESGYYPRPILQQRSIANDYIPRPILQQRSIANDYNPRTNNAENNYCPKTILEQRSTAQPQESRRTQPTRRPTEIVHQPQKVATPRKHLSSVIHELTKEEPPINVAHDWNDHERHIDSVSSQEESPIKVAHDWNVHERLALVERIDSVSARNIVQLFEDENTIPFICRYRKDMIGRKITPNKLRSIRTTYINLIELKNRAEIILKELEEIKQVDNEIRTQILGAKTFKDLEYLNSVYKPTRLDARSLGIDSPALRLLLGQIPIVQLKELVNIMNPNLNTTDKVQTLLSEVISDFFSKKSEILDELLKIQKNHQIVLKCSELTLQNQKNKKNEEKKSKYETYFKFQNNIKYIRPHQILAINRGEKMKFLNVEVILSDAFKNAIRSFIYARFMANGIKYPLRNVIFDKAFEMCYKEKLTIYVNKNIRDELTKKGENDAIECFAKNLKQLLLKPPLRGERVLGIDPGFRNGCKLAIISETSDVLDVGIMYPHNKGQFNQEKWGIKLANLLAKHDCKTIALGDGTACRETELWLNYLFEKGILDQKTIWYDIVSEQGSSVYSCSDLAQQEFPDLDVKLISAVSIARRLIDPLSEYVKVEPRHLGIGMYQMDINEKLLIKSLDDVVSECVSFIGVDINTASLCVLKYIAGLNSKLAQKIIEYRQNNGLFRTRMELLRVDSIGKTTFLQCAGFIRIEPKSLGEKLENTLDCTWVHPESYNIANRIIKECNLNVHDIGNPDFISKIKSFVQSYRIDVLALHYDIPAERLKIVLNALQRELFQDYRPDFDKKLFLKDIRKLDDLFIGQIVTGEVRNIVSYGAFVNIGLGIDALIHRNKMNGTKLKLGDRVSTSVIDLDIARKRVSLRLDEVINS